MKMGFLIHVCQSNLPPVCKNPTVALQLHRAGAVETSKHVGAPSCQNSLRRLLNRTCLLILRHFSAHVRISFATCSLVLFVSMMADFAEATTADCKSRLYSPWILKFSVYTQVTLLVSFLQSVKKKQWFPTLSGIDHGKMSWHWITRFDTLILRMLWLTLLLP